MPGRYNINIFRCKHINSGLNKYTNKCSNDLEVCYCLLLDGWGRLYFLRLEGWTWPSSMSSVPKEAGWLETRWWSLVCGILFWKLGEKGRLVMFQNICYDTAGYSWMPVFCFHVVAQTNTFKNQKITKCTFLIKSVQFSGSHRLQHQFMTTLRERETPVAVWHCHCPTLTFSANVWQLFPSWAELSQPKY